MDIEKTHPYLHTGSARDLSGSDRRLYRLLEILPGFLSYGTLLGFILLSFVRPTLAAYITIIFSIYWLFKTLYLSVHLRHNFKRVRHALAEDWQKRLEGLPRAKDITHLVIFPFYKEGYDVLHSSLEGLQKTVFPHKQIMVVIAAEESAGPDAFEIATRAQKAFAGTFLSVDVTLHPKGVPGELPGKGSNITYAAQEACKMLHARGLLEEQVVVSAFDVDTVVYTQYFSCLTWYFLNDPRPHRKSFQPVPLYNNNIWDAPMLSRVLAYSSTFWQMIQQERPEKLATFSSHALSFKALHEAGYWQRNIVSEDSRIYWNLFMYYDGDYEVVPISYPVSMDANVAGTWLRTAVNLYKQHRRWTWGVENVPYIIFNCIKNPRIPFWKKFRAISVQLEGFWSLATHPMILFLFGWMPLIIGGHSFNVTVLSYNLPIVAKGFLTLAMVGLVFSAIFTMYLIPQRPGGFSLWRSSFMIVQWILVPLTMVFFSAIPGLETQGRLMIGRYMGFWVTPKGKEA